MTDSFATKPDAHRDFITAAVLAGGRATRMGGEDKGLVEVASRPMVEHIVTTLEPQVTDILINANRNLARYGAITGCPVVSDTVEGFAGPLAGIASIMAKARTPLVLSVPCDSPLVCPDLAYRLWQALERDDAIELAVAHDGVRLQPVFALLRCRLLPSLLDYLKAGERKIDLWYGGHRMTEVDFSDDSDTFLNINTPQERDALEERLLSADAAKSAHPDAATVS